MRGKGNPMPKTYLEHLLGDNEKVLFSARQHWFILARSIALEIFFILVLFVGTIIGVFFEQSIAVWIGIAGGVLMLIPLVSMIYDILVWSHYQFIITNWRVMQVRGIINKSITDSSLDKVNDVKMTQSLFGRIFGYGDVEILTASELGVNLFKRIEDPVHFKTAMLNAKEALEHQPAAASKTLDVPAMINQLDQLRKQGIVTEEEFQQKKKELLAKI